MITEKTGVSLTQHGGSLICVLHGEIDHHAARTIRSEIDAEVQRVRPEQLKLDLSQVSFMDSSGLGLILGRYQTAASVGASLSLVDPNPGVTRVLSLAGIERLIRIERRAGKPNT